MGLSPGTLPAGTINAAYNQTITANSTNAGKTTLAVTNIANPIAGLTVPTSGTNTLAITGTPTATGTETFTVTATDPSGASSSANYSITINPAATFSPASLPAGTTNTAYSQTITTSSGTGTSTLAVTNIVNAIAGLTVPTSGTGSIAISGTPTGSGTETFNVSATDQAGNTVNKSYSITIDPALTPATLVGDTINTAYNQTIGAAGTGTINLAVTNIQNAIAGLTVPTSGTGSLAITGTPTATGTETFTVTATDPNHLTTSTNYSITVNPAVTFSPTSPLPAGTTNTAYSQTITASNGTGTKTKALSNITKGNNCFTVTTSGRNSLAITGTPTGSGTETVTVTSTDQAGATSTSIYSITINPALSPSTLAAGSVNTAYSQTITASGTGTINLVVSNLTNAIPGLNVPTTGTGSLVISGTTHGHRHRNLYGHGHRSLPGDCTLRTNYSITMKNPGPEWPTACHGIKDQAAHS